MLNPSIKEMLLVGQSCDINSLEDALNNYLNHYDLFFSIDKFEEQSNNLVKQLIANGLTYIDENGKPSLKDISVDEALNILGINTEQSIN